MLALLGGTELELPGVCELMLPWLEGVALCEPTPLELDVWSGGVWLEGGVLVAGWFPSCPLTGALPTLVWPLLLPIVLEDEGACWLVWLCEVIAPLAPPLELAPGLVELDELEQVSAILFTLDTVKACAAFELAAILPALLCAFADDALLAGDPMICTCCPTWLCSRLVSPCNW